MYLIYIDDSGDIGPWSGGSTTKAFVLSALAVDGSEWLSTLENIVAFRRFLRNNFGIRMRDELKASRLVHGSGPFRGVSDGARLRIYRQALRLQVKIGLKTWAVVIDKVEWDKNKDLPQEAEAIHERAWRHMIQRIERFTYYEKDTCIVLPDEGHPKFVTGIFRRMRRFSLVPSAYDPDEVLERQARLIVEDPNFRNSLASYFLHLTDLNAYAAYRSMYPISSFGADYWQHLGGARVDVSKLRRREKSWIPLGISPWPER